MRSLNALNASTVLGELAEIFGEGGGLGSAFLELFGSYADGSGHDRFSREALALVSVKNHAHGALNPCARYPTALTVEDVLASRLVAGPMTLLMCAQLSDGAAALVLTGSRTRGAERSVRIAASVLASGRGDDLRLPSAM